jgi:hypothetical protein
MWRINKRRRVGGRREYYKGVTRVLQGNTFTPSLFLPASFSSKVCYGMILTEHSKKEGK